MKKNEIPFKAWLLEKAEKMLTRPAVIYAAYRRGGDPRLRVRKVNARVWYVRVVGVTPEHQSGRGDDKAGRASES